MMTAKGRQVNGYIEDEKLYKNIIKYCNKMNISRSELINLALKDYLENEEKEWQVLFKAFERLNRRMEKVETNQTINSEIMLWLVQMVFMAIPRNYTEAELMQIDDKVEEDMRSFMKALTKALQEGGIYSPKLQGMKLDTEN
jgi:hypothetical protein